MKVGTVLTPVAMALAGISLAASATTLRVANQGDALSMDPHSLNESLQLTVTGNVFEALLTRGRDYKLTPGLATDWKQTSPTVW
ncbi:MAG: ABC transporter substrate-binding protein, partial [Rhodoferax sp.]